MIKINDIDLSFLNPVIQRMDAAVKRVYKDTAWKVARENGMIRLICTPAYATKEDLVNLLNNADHMIADGVLKVDNHRYNVTVLEGLKESEYSIVFQWDGIETEWYQANSAILYNSPGSLYNPLEAYNVVGTMNAPSYDLYDIEIDPMIDDIITLDISVVNGIVYGQQVPADFTKSGTELLKVVDKAI